MSNVIIALPELSDEPIDRAFGGYDFSPRLAAVLERLPSNEVRISNALLNASVLTVAALQALTDDRLRRMKGIGGKYTKDIDKALSFFDLARNEHAIIVRANANPIEAHIQRLQKWIVERIEMCEAEEKRVGRAGAAHETHEREVLTDVMLILDGRAPTNKRYWSMESIDEREAERESVKRPDQREGGGP